MSHPICAPLFALALLAALASCAPNLQSMRPDDDDEASVVARRTNETDEREANRAALEELRDRAIAADAPPRAVPLQAPPIVVLAPDRVSALTPNGSLKRSALMAFVERGPHAFLGALVMEPARNATGSVLGFRIVEFLDGGDFLQEAGLLAGDIIRRVNGSSIVLPDQFIAVWEGLGEADSVNVEIVRDGTEIAFRWPIDEDA